MVKAYLSTTTDECEVSSVIYQHTVKAGNGYHVDGSFLTSKLKVNKNTCSFLKLPNFTNFFYIRLLDFSGCDVFSFQYLRIVLVLITVCVCVCVCINFSV